MPLPSALTGPPAPRNRGLYAAARERHSGGTADGRTDAGIVGSAPSQTPPSQTPTAAAAAKPRFQRGISRAPQVKNRRRIPGQGPLVSGHRRGGFERNVSDRDGAAFDNFGDPVRCPSRTRRRSESHRCSLLQRRLLATVHHERAKKCIDRSSGHGCGKSTPKARAGKMRDEIAHWREMWISNPGGTRRRRQRRRP
ncbi:uncharacterized protein LOC116955972 isoform X3 [Petromyzon marinus]|uniref:uncharacterized protein LOC116955972 isoform X3 n=1 Tax=Petromyzon marinus TaxID=7757 RepID=UPI003F6F2D66